MLHILVSEDKVLEEILCSTLDCANSYEASLRNWTFSRESPWEWHASYTGQRRQCSGGDLALSTWQHEQLTSSSCRGQVKQDGRLHGISRGWHRSCIAYWRQSYGGNFALGFGPCKEFQRLSCWCQVLIHALLHLNLQRNCTHFIN